MMKNSRRRLMLSLFVSAPLLLAPVASALSSGDRGTVVVAMGDDLKDWDPAIGFSGEIDMFESVYETLTKYNLPGSKDTVSPGLATSWTHNADSSEWTFKLRSDVTFHDGTPMNAAAVKSSIERTVALKQGAYYIWEGLDRIEAPDDHTVVFRCAHPMAVATIASAQYGSYIYSPAAAAHGTDWFNQGHDGGSGPFMVKEWQKDTQTILVKNPAYWGKTIDGGFGTAILKVVREPATQLQLLRSGEVDFIEKLAPDDIAAVQADPDLQVDLAPSFKNIHMLINANRPPTNNLKFRQALAYAMDYQSVVDGVFAGAGTATNGPIPSTQWGHADGLAVPTFDLAKAKQLLDESGVPADARSLTLTYPSDDEGYKNAAQLLQANAATIGIDVQLKPGPWGAIWDRQKHLDTAENIIEVTLWPTYPTPSDILISIYRTEDPTVFNLGHYNNPAYNTVLNEAVALEAADPKQSLARYAEAEKILVDDVASIGVIDLKNWMPHRKDVEGYIYNPGYNGYDFAQFRRR